MSDPGDSDRPHQTHQTRRPTLVVATIGHHRHGKTTLTAAITQLLARRTPEDVRPVTTTEIDARTGSPPLELHGERLIPSPRHHHIMGVPRGETLETLAPKFPLRNP